MIAAVHRFLARRAYAQRVAAIASPFGSPAYALATCEALDAYELALELAEIA